MKVDSSIMSADRNSLVDVPKSQREDTEQAPKPVRYAGNVTIISLGI